MRIAYGNIVCCVVSIIGGKFSQDSIRFVWCFFLTHRFVKRLVKMFKKKYPNFMTVACSCVCVYVNECWWERDDCMMQMTDDLWPMTDWLMTWRDYIFYFCFWFFNIYIYHWINVSLSFHSHFRFLILFRTEVFGLCNTSCFAFCFFGFFYFVYIVYIIINNEVEIFICSSLRDRFGFGLCLLCFCLNTWKSFE